MRVKNPQKYTLLPAGFIRKAGKTHATHQIPHFAVDVSLDFHSIPELSYKIIPRPIYPPMSLGSTIPAGFPNTRGLQRGAGSTAGGRGGAQRGWRLRGAPGGWHCGGLGRPGEMELKRPDSAVFMPETGRYGSI